MSSPQINICLINLNLARNWIIIIMLVRRPTEKLGTYGWISHSMELVAVVGGWGRGLVVVWWGRGGSGGEVAGVMVVVEKWRSG